MIMSSHRDHRLPYLNLLLGFCFASVLASSPSFAHDYWANGKKVPDWVKASCCGQADAHALEPDQVHHKDGYYLVDGYNGHIPDAKAIPSQDGHYWIFYRDNYSNDGTSHSQSGVYCFFVPMDF